MDWPASMGALLGAQEAGRPLSVGADRFFRRETDRAVRLLHGKSPLGVGADRIARTALAALRLLGEMERRLGAPILLAWSPETWRHPAAIEVYPAGKLRANRLRAAGYRSPDAADLRSALLRELAGIYRLRPVVPPHQLVRNPPRLRRRDSEGRATAPLRAGRCGVEGGYGSRPRDTVGRTGTE